MKIAVIGAGAVGAAFAVMLKKSGHDVEVTARGEHLQSIQANGLSLSGGLGKHSVTLPAHPMLTSADYDLVIVSTKASDALGAIKQNLSQIGNSDLLILQNGLVGVASARSILPNNRIAGGLVLFASSLTRPGEVTITAALPSYIGSDLDPDFAKELAGELNQSIPCEFNPDLISSQWSKLVVNGVNALPAITGLSVQQVAKTKLLDYMTRSMQETVKVGLASGIKFAKIGLMSHCILVAFSKLPTWLANYLPRKMSQQMGDTPNPGSTLQSIRRGKLTEIDYLNGAVVTIGETVAVPTPVNQKLTQLVHRVEQEGFLSVTETLRELKRSLD